MASHVRYITKIGGAYYQGRQALEALERLSGHLVRTREDAIAIAKLMRAPLWIFREPRLVGPKRSRYKKICWEFGIGRPGKKRKINFNYNYVVVQGQPPQLNPLIPQQVIDLVQGAQNAAPHGINGYAAAAGHKWAVQQVANELDQQF